MNRLRAACGALALAGILIACSSVESDWQQATTANTVASYQQFLQQHPTGAHSQEAHTRLQQLQDEQAWTAAQDANSAEGYQQYLQNEPNGAHAQEAHDRMAGLERAAAWKAAQAENTPAAMQQFLQKYPQGPEADQARAQLQKLNNQYVAELGSYHSSDAAEQERAKLAQRYGSQLQGLQVVAPSGKSHSYRVTSAPLEHDDAVAACNTMRKAHQHCQVVKRPGADEAAS